MSQTKTPVAVRVARWTAITAAITALGTIGNTFIDKRPWFLSGEAEDPKPAVVATAAPKMAPAPGFEASPSVHFSMPSNEERAKAAARFESDLVENLLKSGKTPEEAKAMARMAMSVNVGTTSAMSSDNMPQAVMAGVPDMGPWRNFLNFVEYRPVAAWLIMGSVSLTIVAVVAELIIRKRRKKMIMFDAPPPST